METKQTKHGSAHPPLSLACSFRVKVGRMVVLTHQVHPLSLEMLVSEFECQPCAYIDAWCQGPEHSLLVSEDDSNGKRGLWRARGHTTHSINSSPCKAPRRASDACLTASTLQTRTIKFRKRKSLCRHRADRMEAQPHIHGRYPKSWPSVPAWESLCPCQEPTEWAPSSSSSALSHITAGAYFPKQMVGGSGEGP
jgi:hypothetical protein